MLRLGPGLPLPPGAFDPGWQIEQPQGALAPSQVLLPGQQNRPMPGVVPPGAIARPPQMPPPGGPSPFMPAPQPPPQQQALDQALKPKASGAQRRPRAMFNRNAPGMPNGGYGQYQPTQKQPAGGFQFGF